MPIAYTRIGGGPTDGSNFLRAARDVIRVLNQELSPVGEAVKGEAQGFIDIAGTQRYWSGTFNTAQGPRGRAGRGRIDSGHMRAAIDFRVTHGAGVGIDVGWIHQYEEYFGAQEDGFSAGGFRPSQTVEGMGMFQHLRVYMRGKVDEAADRAMERIVSGL